MSKEEVKEKETEKKAEKPADSQAKKTDGISEEKTAETVEKAETSEKTEEQPKELTVEEKLAESEKQVAELKDQYLRKCADFDNYRKRMIREKQDAIDYANSNLLTDLLEILDNFDRAIENCGDEKDADVSKSFVDGVKMIKNQLKDKLESKYELKAFGVPGEGFDPEKHEAIGKVEGDVSEPTLQAVYQKGYYLKDRILRNAKVFVEMPKNKE